MGVDAQMLVRIPRPVSDNELKAWSYRFGSMCHHWLFLGFKDRQLHKPLERITIFQQDGDDIRPEGDETLLEVHLSGRYYGEDYERGDLIAYVGMAEFLETLIPGASVWYGGDSSGICVQPFDKARRAALLKHAATAGHDPYMRDNPLISDALSGANPLCPSCDVRMARCGYGGHGNYALWRCSGCGWQIERRDGKTREGFTLKDEKATA